jgi:hypothetical protein
MLSFLELTQIHQSFDYTGLALFPTRHMADLCYSGSLK